ncbi:hypothetical protein M3Y97_00077100 [Aphelenchoides bicaudatus]|nr:hypothetical protein M3Y97_00077100 [Aphelenchoides bicaudatus]
MLEAFALVATNLCSLPSLFELCKLTTVLISILFEMFKTYCICRETMCSMIQLWTSFLLVLCSALAIQSTPLYMYPKTNVNDLQNSEGFVIRSEFLPSMFKALYDDPSSSRFVYKRNIAIGRGDGFRPGKK